MKITRKNIEKLCRQTGYNPEKIGIAFLRLLGFKVNTFMLSPDIYVYDKKGKLVYYEDYPIYID